MSKIEDVVNALEHKINIVLDKYVALEEANQKLLKKIVIQQQQLSQYNIALTKWKDDYNTLKIANSMLGSDANKRETKLKINTLIRDIDHCISQLSE